MDILGVIGLQVFTLAATVAATKATVSGLQERVLQLERKFDDLPRAYVPRSEVELALKGIESITRNTNSMLQALIYNGRADHRIDLKGVEAAAAPRDFTQICIDGLDGNGGLNRWEGRTSFLYLDNRKIDGIPAPLATIGVGCAVDLCEALTLPFTIDDRRATTSEIAADYAAVKAAPFDMVAGFYARCSRCRLSDDAIDELIRARFAVFIPALRRLFPAFDTFPETVKAGCLDLIYGLGVEGLSPPHYPCFRSAVNRGDWAAAAAQCGSDEAMKAYVLRNDARSDLFEMAAPRKETAQ